MPEPAPNAGAAGSETPTPPASEQPAGGAASGTGATAGEQRAAGATGQQPSGEQPKDGQQPPAKTEDAKQEPPKSEVPEKYDLKLPENSLLDAAAPERTAATARELGLSQEQAQKALEFVHSEVASREAAFLEAHQPGGAAWTEQETKWREAALADAEVGGSPEKLQASAQLGKRVLSTFGSDGLNEFLEKTGFGSHPEVLRFVAKIGKAMSEGSLAVSGPQGGASEQDRLLSLYPTMQPK